MIEGHAHRHDAGLLLHVAQCEPQIAGWARSPIRPHVGTCTSSDVCLEACDAKCGTAACSATVNTLAMTAVCLMHLMGLNSAVRQPTLAPHQPWATGCMPAQHKVLPVHHTTVPRCC